MKKTVIILISPALLLAAAPTAHAQNTVEPRGFTYRTAGFALTYGQQTFAVDSKTLQGWQGNSIWPQYSSLDWQADSLPAQLANASGFASPATEEPATWYHYRLDKIYDFISALSGKLNQPASEPKLIIQNNSVTDFSPPQIGLEVDALDSVLAAAAALETKATSSPLTVNEIKPATSLGDTNDLGIRELIAEGTSSFRGSPNNRKHNIAVGVEKMKGLLLAPGATFSFDDNLGPVDGEHGFLPELVIKSNNTVPEFGGGLCQVSTTAFRAAMAGGLPIKERRNHAYAVSYYSPQGTDATIYPGSADLKFVNDTPGYILIWPYEKDPATLVFDFYGTKDGRQVTLEKPVVYDRQDDGSMKATWTRLVTKDGNTSTSTFKSTYQPPALFHKTEGFATATPSTITAVTKTN